MTTHGIFVLPDQRLGLLAIHSLIFHLIVLLFGFSPAVTAQPADNLPVKLQLASQARVHQVGNPMTVTLNLLNAQNQLTAASKELVISLLSSAPGSAAVKTSVSLPAGSATTSIPFRFDTTGLYEIQARHPELLDGGLILNVQAPPETRRSGTRNSGSSSINITEILARHTDLPRLELRVTPQRNILADGRDSATVYALLTGDNALAVTDLEVRLYNDNGQLKPRTIMIPKGGYSGEAELTSQHIGPINLEYLGTSPEAAIKGETLIQVNFTAPISRLELKASPPRISLFERAQFVVRLLDEHGVAQVSDAPRPVFFTLEQGQGELSETDIMIPALGSEGRIDFTPSITGQVVLMAASPNLLSVQVPLHVQWPLLTLILSVLGGLTGGFLVFISEEDTHWWRCVVGLVTGLVLYWALLFGGLNFIPRMYALNYISAFVISVLGGWLGTKVFSHLLRRFGIQA